MRFLLLATLLLIGCKKNIPIPAVTAPNDAATIARGEYLATKLVACVTCHSPRDWSRWSGPANLSRAMSGGDNVGPTDGFGPRSVMVPSNLTAHALRDWSDGELVRAITQGMAKGDRALFPSMPYPEYRSFAMDDALAIVAWLRTLPPVVNETPKRELPFPMELVTNIIPRAVELRPKAPKPTDADYGAYLTHISGCTWCHSPVNDRSQPIAGLEFSGGHEFMIPAPGKGIVVSSNLTGDAETGIGAWTKDDFIKRFRGFDVEELRAKELAPGSVNTVMPWVQFHDITEEDLGAMFDYLRSLPPKKNLVKKFK